MSRALALLLLLALAACVQPAAPPSPPAAAPQTVPGIIAAIEPLAESMCRQQRRGTPCDFTFALDDRPDMPPNAFQTIDRSGRPWVVLTASLLSLARNADEIAFVLGHESAHHIAGHIPRRQDEALSGAILAGVLAAASGLPPDEVEAAQSLGAEIGARRYSQEFELEADALGAEIAFLAGYDPVRGAAFFDRLPQPDEAFLSTHPPSAQRKAVVAATVRRLTAQ